MIHNEENTITSPRTRAYYLPLAMLGFASALVLFVLFLFWYLNSTPNSFPLQEKITIESGTSVQEIGTQLQNAGVVRSSNFLQLLIHIYFNDRTVQAGTYQFTERLSGFAVAEALTAGDYGVPPLRITIHEGLRVDQIGELLSEPLPTMSVLDFRDAADGLEGYLFPDTYFIPESFTAEETVTLLRTTFDEKIEPFLDDIEASGYTLNEIVTMASIIEREADNGESMGLVSGILWNRIAIDMPLQVDAPFEYILGKTSAELTLEELRVESPYNTYVNKGLPPAPIANPGLDTIEAALNPVDSPYLYYLTGNDGIFRYAETFDEHKRNKALYLR